MAIRRWHSLLIATPWNSFTKAQYTLNVNIFHARHKATVKSQSKNGKETINISHGPKDTMLLMGYNVYESDLESHIDTLKQSLKLKMMTLDFNSPDIAQSYTDLAMAQHQSVKHLAEARKNYCNAFEIWKAIKGESSRQVANILCLLGVVLRDLGDVEAARTALHKSLEIDKETNDAVSNLCSVYAINNLAGIEHLACNYAEASQLYEEAIQIMLTATYGDPNHRMISVFYYNLACSLAAMEDYIGAETALLRSREIIMAIGDSANLSDRIQELLQQVQMKGDDE
ncbi:bifunctional Tetratricopeptide-like helical domain superfamily/Tetratricopeptide repeat [Babesia duncani]|uniref:Bifunctional Tetratricopeptide-like helical domain superfamily/Tetratricopeptide repeat n=1 Tax=Babesia duncani TaxID=323732 RepID=A0AAD9UPD7_9APIC|nr:bifunctional Tetratricopeptide-like helical domain superfamily/Tetratricopeptide repeat [Babesia duncani]